MAGLTYQGTNWANKKFVPEIYAAKVLKRYYANDVTQGVTNQDYSGTLSKGEKVHIRREPKFTPQDHLVNAPFSFQLVNDEETILSIDYDKLTTAQIPFELLNRTDINIEPMVQESMRKVHTRVIQQTIFQSSYSTATSTVASTDWQTAGNSSKAIMAAKVKLDDLEIPAEDRWLLVSPAMTMYMALEQANWAQNMGTDKGAQYEGFVGYYAGFRVYQTPYLAGQGTSGAPWEAMAGHKDAIGLATTITNAKAVDLTPSGYLGMGIVFQTLFGFNTLQPDALVRLRAQTA
jgi:hypothetical protein